MKVRRRVVGDRTLKESVFGCVGCEAGTENLGAYFVMLSDPRERIFCANGHAGLAAAAGRSDKKGPRMARRRTGDRGTGTSARCALFSEFRLTDAPGASSLRLARGAGSAIWRVLKALCCAPGGTSRPCCAIRPPSRFHLHRQGHHLLSTSCSGPHDEVRRAPSVQSSR